MTLALELSRQPSHPQIIIMTGTELSTEEAAICQQYDFPIVRKPFLPRDILDAVRSRIPGASVARLI